MEHLRDEFLETMAFATEQVHSLREALFLKDAGAKRMRAHLLEQNRQQNGTCECTTAEMKRMAGTESRPKRNRRTRDLGNGMHADGTRRLQSRAEVYVRTLEGGNAKAEETKTHAPPKCGNVLC